MYLRGLYNRKITQWVKCYDGISVNPGLFCSSESQFVFIGLECKAKGRNAGRREEAFC